MIGIGSSAVNAILFASSTWLAGQSLAASPSLSAFSGETAAVLQFAGNTFGNPLTIFGDTAAHSSRAEALALHETQGLLAFSGMMQSDSHEIPVNSWKILGGFIVAVLVVLGFFTLLESRYRVRKLQVLSPQPPVKGPDAPNKLNFPAPAPESAGQWVEAPSPTWGGSILYPQQPNFYPQQPNSSASGVVPSPCPANQVGSVFVPVGKKVVWTWDTMDGWNVVTGFSIVPKSQKPTAVS